MFSGGGYQAFWKLEEPLTLDGSDREAEEAKRWNLQIEFILKADNCHNIDRVMRLPGTINRPDARKQAKGQKAELAKVVEFSDTTFSIAQFTKAQLPTTNGGIESSPRKKLDISGNRQPLSPNLSELDPYDISDRVRAIIVQGFDPDDPNRFSSPSEWQWYVSCELARRVVPAELHLSVLMDSELGISGTIYKKGTSAERYAIRQIEKAEEEAIDPALRELNTKHAFICHWGGSACVIEEVFDPTLDRTSLNRISMADFRARYGNRKVTTGVNQQGHPVQALMGKWWLEHPQRREYQTVGFTPDRDHEGVYNLWKGFACDAVPGDCGLFLDHILENICSGDPVRYNYLIGWLANMVQRPHQPGHVAVVLCGDPGTGKSFLANHVGQLFGRHYLAISNPKFLVGSFNAHLRDCVFLLGDEAFWAGDKAHEGVLKQLITDPITAIEAKGVDVTAGKNCIHLMMASNEDWVVPVGYKDRRFFVLDVLSAHRRDRAYFNAIDTQFQNGGREALLHFLLNFDLTGFDVTSPPETRALQEQKEKSLGIVEGWWKSKLDDGRLLEHSTKWGSVLCSDLAYDYVQHSRAVGRNGGGPIALGRFLKQICPGMKKKRLGTKRKVTQLDGSLIDITAPYQYDFPSLEECRSDFRVRFGGDWIFPEVDTLPEIEDVDPDDDGGGAF